MNARVCDYCGLPVASRSDLAGPVYCCLGCRFAASATGASGEQGRNRSLLVRLGWAIFFTLNASMFSMVLWQVDVYNAPTDGEQPERLILVLHDLFRYLTLVFSVPVLWLLGGVLAESAWDHIRQRTLSTDILLASGVLASFVYSAISVFRGSGPIYFEVGCIVLVAVTLGRWLEASGKLRVTETLHALEKLLPTTVRRVQGSRIEMVAIERARPGELIRVHPGERIPLDGIVERNQGAVDEQLVTGESAPAIKEMGDRVYAGTLNRDGDFWIRVTAGMQEGTLRKLIDAVVAAAMTKTRAQRLADRLSTGFVPLVVTLALAATAFQGWTHGVEAAILAGLSVVVIACPCALGVATPLAVWAAIGRAARDGMILRNGDVLTKLARVRAICFDKTGTLTTGAPEIDAFQTDEHGSHEEVLEAALSLAIASQHALSQGIREYASGLVGARTLVQVRSVPGRGVCAVDEAGPGDLYLGSPRFMQEGKQAISGSLQRTIDEAEQRGKPTVCVAWGGVVRGVFVFRETLREDARDAIAALQNAGLTPRILTGDQAARASALAQSLGIPIRAKLLPGEKLAEIRELREQFGAVAMVGDGVNDAPALAAADVGIALGCGADISRDAADICLLSNRLAPIATALELGKATVRTIRFNLFWAFAFNCVGIPIAMSGRLNPVIAAAAMIASSTLVIANSMRLLGARQAGA